MEMMVVENVFFYISLRLFSQQVLYSMYHEYTHLLYFMQTFCIICLIYSKKYSWYLPWFLCFLQILFNLKHAVFGNQVHFIRGYIFVWLQLWVFFNVISTQ